MLRLSLVLACAVCYLHTPLASAADLNAIREAASEQDTQWRTARKEWESAQELGAQGRATLLPSINLQHGRYRNKQETEGQLLDRRYDSTSTSLNIVQPLFRPGAWFTHKQAQAQVSAAEARFMDAEQAHLLRTAEQYFSVLRAWENRVTAQAEYKALERRLEQVQESHAVGLVPIADMHEAEAAFDLSRVSLIMAESDFSIQQGELHALTGKSWSALAPLKTTLPMPPPEPADPELWVAQAKQQNYQLLAAQAQAESARQASRQQLSAQLPTVDLVARYSENEQPVYTANAIRGNDIETEGQVVGIEVTVPLFQGGALNSRRKQAAFDHQAAQERYRQTWRDVAQQARTLFLTSKADALRVEARRQGMRSAASALEAAEEGYKVGTRNVVDLLTAQRNMYAARREYANARYDYIINSLRLKAIAGELTASDLEQVNTWLNPDQPVALGAMPNAQADTPPGLSAP